MRLLFESATYTKPDESTATPAGKLKLADVPTGLSTNAPDPVPANVVVTPVGEILRMRALFLSAT